MSYKNLRFTKNIRIWDIGNLINFFNQNLMRIDLMIFSEAFFNNRMIRVKINNTMELQCIMILFPHMPYWDK